MIKSTLEEWKKRAQESMHVRKGEVVQFSGPDERGVIRAFIPWSPINISLGNYFTTTWFKDSWGERVVDVEAGTGWIADDHLLPFRNNEGTGSPRQDQS